ncbi:MAG: N-acetylneuraminate synthase family protein [Peptoanaerobacter stomatis]|uniref:N-acetylneuraminate synthase family protein n=1 Tax=Peptoanaerobacter stomatis TaxID=796937 RepID=UPI003FA03F22
MGVFIIGEIGINHNGDMAIAKKLIDIASIAGMNAVKFQKRDIDMVYTDEYLKEHRVSPWGTTQREQKEGLEFSVEEYDEIDRYCKEKNIEWFFSAWDINSQKLMRKYNLKYNKVASAMITNYELLKEIASEKKYTFISTGMSTLDEIDSAVDIFKKNDCPYELMHCNSSYPMEEKYANLKMIETLRERYKVNIGFSSHEIGNICTLASVSMGATSVERHITLDKNMYGSDQKASIEPEQVFELVKNIRIIEKAMGDGLKVLSVSEEEMKKKLRG